MDIFSSKASKSEVGPLPVWYTQYLEVSNCRNVPLKPTAKISEEDMILQSQNFKGTSDEEDWLAFVDENIFDNAPHNLSWEAYHASRERASKKSPCITSLLPLFKDDSKSPSMVRHGFDVIRRTTNFLNPLQTPVMEVDQPLFAIAKQIQWLFPDEYGEDVFVVLLGGLHLEKASFSMLGQLIDNTGWKQVISIVSNVFTFGKADSFLSCSHITRSRYAHQVTAAALKILLLKAYRNSSSESSINDWSINKEKKAAQFKFWCLI